MGDLTSLILQMKAAGGLSLTVDASPLEAVLLEISQTLQLHDVVVAKFPEVEAVHCDLRKDVNKLRLALESVTVAEDSDAHEGEDDSDAANESKACDSANASGLEERDHYSCYGVRECDVDPSHRNRAGGFSSADDRGLANSLRGMKYSLRRLQQHQDEGSANSMELCESIQSLKGSLHEVQQKLASSVSMDQMQLLQQSLVAKYGRMEHCLGDFKTDFRKEVDESIHQNLVAVRELEVSMTERHDKLEKRVASCAKEQHVAAFRESTEADVATLENRTAFLDATARAQGRALTSLQQKHAIGMIYRHYAKWKQHALAAGLSRWKQAVQQQRTYEEGKKSQKRLLRKTLTNVMSRRKRFGFERWIRHRDWHRKDELRKLRAMTLICERLAMCMSAPKTMAFYRWRRLTIMDKMMIIRLPSSSSSGVRQEEAALDMSYVMNSFKSDVRGATYALAQEIESIKSHDIASLRRDWCDKHQKLMLTIQTTMNEAIHRVEDTANEFQGTISDRVDGCTNDLPMVHSNLKDLADQFECNRDKLKSVEESHENMINALSDQEQQLEQRLCSVEKQTETDANEITALVNEQDKIDESIQCLRDIITANQKSHEEERRKFQRALDHFGDELLKTKVTLGHTQVRCGALEKELAESKLELLHFQNSCESENDSVRHHIQSSGILKPALDRIVNVGHAYEVLAIDRGYVTGINVTTTLRTTTAILMKRSGGSNKKEEEVDVPSEIFAFAHDYAAWVAYQTDNDLLLRLVTNSEEQVYAEDDMMTRRKELCSELKPELETLLEKAYSSQTAEDDTNKNSPPNARGLKLRWEARSIFLARLVDATDAAISKHDQILLPAYTRLGRSRPLSANVTVCVACDRPMRRKGNRNPPSRQRSDGEKLEQRSVPTETHTQGKEYCTSDPLELRPQSSASCKTGGLYGGDAVSYARNSSFPSTGQVIKASRLAQSLKENSEPFPNFDINNTL